MVSECKVVYHVDDVEFPVFVFLPERVQNPDFDHSLFVESRFVSNYLNRHQPIRFVIMRLNDRPK